ncbi:MAG: hypothetical protein EOP84_34505, partial [Verrucomicrobiaceae bacterium]
MAAINDWGEFAGLFSRATADMAWYRSEYDYLEFMNFEYESKGAYFFDGNYHATFGEESVYGISNDPQILVKGYNGPWRIWSDSVIAPLHKLSPTLVSSMPKLKICDNGLLVVQKDYKSLKTLTRTDDADHDGMPDDWESFYGLNPNDPSDRTGDADNDGIPNYLEFRYRGIPATP